MPISTGDRVRIRRPDTRTRARHGDFATVVEVRTRRSDGRRFPRVRLERDFSRTAQQRSNGYDYTLEESQLEPAPAPQFRVGQRVRLRDGARTLSSHFISEPAGTEGEITVLSDGWDRTNDGERILVRTGRDSWYVFLDQIEPVETPAPADTRPRVNVGDRIVCIRANGVAEATGQAGTVTLARFDRTPPSLRVRFDRVIADSSEWNVHEWRLETAAPDAEPAREIQVGDRVRLRDGASCTLQGHFITDPVGTEGTVTAVNTSSTRRYYTVRTARELWHCYRDQVELVSATAPAPAPTAGWVPATAENMVVGARIRYINPGAPDSISVGDTGVVAQMGLDRDRARIRMDNPTAAAHLTGTGPESYHWFVAFDDIEVAAAPVWAVDMRVRRSTPEHYRDDADDYNYGDRESRLGDLGTIRTANTGSLTVRWDNGNTSSISHRNVEPYVEPAAVVERWVRLNSLSPEDNPVGRRVRYASIDGTDMPDRLHVGDLGVVVFHAGGTSSYRIRMDNPRSQRTTGRGADAYNWLSSGADFEVNVGDQPVPITTPAPAETPRAADGEVTFTDEQKRAIARIATRYGESHGFERMAREIVTALGADPASGNRRQARLTFSVDVELEGNDITLPASADDLRGYIRTSQANALVDAVLNRRLRRVGDATMGDRGITYRD